jgi:hypothetical protein
VISDLICPECYGDGGWTDDDSGVWEECDICDGTGIFVRSEDHYKALERWALANGFVRVESDG